MSQKFTITPQMKKQEIIDEATRLLDAYRKTVRESEEARKRLSEAEKQRDAVAAKAADETSVEGVVETLVRLRTQFGKTVSDLTERMTAQAEKVESLNAAVTHQEKRLKELHDIEAAADALARLVSAYEERRQDAEAQFEARKQELESTYATRFDQLERELAGKRSALEQEIADKKTAWKLEQEQIRKAWGEEKAEAEKVRAREEAEYLYDRDRKRKIEEDQYQEKRAAVEKELAEKKAVTERELAEREQAVKGREEHLTALQTQVDSFPVTLEKEIQRAAREAQKQAEQAAAHEARVAALEHEWERKVFQQKVANLEAAIADQREKLAELREEHALARKQVQEIADKAVEGASLAKAFQSVNSIALEQARKPERSTKD